MTSIAPWLSVPSASDALAFSVAEDLPRKRVPA